MLAAGYRRLLVGAYRDSQHRRGHHGCDGICPRTVLTTTTLGGAPTTDFFGGTAAGSGTYNVGLVAANSNTIPTLVNLASGQANGSSATITIESAKINSIANTLAACVNSTGQTNATETTTACGKLFNYTKPAGTRPADTLQAAVQMSVYPYRNVSNLYNLATGSAPFGGLSVAPNDWTVAVSYTIPTFGLGINGNGGLQTSSNIDIDAARARSGSRPTRPQLKVSPSSTSASGTFNGPYSTALGHSQYVAIDGVGNIWSTDLASATVVSNSTTSPATTGTSYTATTSSAAGGPVVVASDNTVLFAYTTTGGLHNVGQISSNAFSVNYANEFTGTPTGLASAGAHYAFAATESTSQGCEEEILGTPQSQSGGSCSSGGIAATTQGNDFLLTATSLNKVADNNEDDYFTPPVPVSGPEGVAIDGKGNLWIANSGNASVSTFSYINNNFDDSDYHQTSPIAYLHDSTHGNTPHHTLRHCHRPQAGNVWVSNAGCVSTSSTCLATQLRPHGACRRRRPDHHTARRAAVDLYGHPARLRRLSRAHPRRLRFIIRLGLRSGANSDAEFHNLNALECGGQRRDRTADAGLFRAALYH